MNKLCIGLLFATAIAWAGIGVVNFPYGEKSGGPDACRAIQLNVQGVSPASGTVSIGEITNERFVAVTNDWFATGWEIVDGTTNHVESLRLSFEVDFGWMGYDESSGVDLALSYSYISIPTYQGFCWDFTFLSGSGEVLITNHTETALSMLIEADDCKYTLTRTALSHDVRECDTNALWTVTAAGGSAVTNFPDKTFLRFAGHDFVRYGTATGGVVNLFVED